MNNRKIKIVIKKDKENPETKEFHVRERLSRFPEFYECPDDVVEFNDNEQAPNNAYLLADKLFQIAGTQSVLVNGHIIKIEISAAFQWVEVTDKIKEIIKVYISAQKFVSDSTKKF